MNIPKPENYSPLTIRWADHPHIYEAKKNELMAQGLTEQEAINELQQSPEVEIELIYAPNQGLFAVESDALESITIFNPYDGEVLGEPEE